MEKMQSTAIIRIEEIPPCKEKFQLINNIMPKYVDISLKVLLGFKSKKLPLPNILRHLGKSQWQASMDNPSQLQKSSNYCLFKGNTCTDSSAYN